MPQAKKTNKKEKDKIAEEITKFLDGLFDKLNVEAQFEVTKEQEDSGIKEENYKVNIITSETGLLIGRHGEVLNSLQLLLGVVLYKKIGEWIRVVVDVGDYRKMREENIKEMVSRITNEVEINNTPVMLPYLTPLERRIVHMMLADNPKVVSESTGEGRDRRVTVKPRI